MTRPIFEETHQPGVGECGFAVEWVSAEEAAALAEAADVRYYCLKCKKRVGADEVYPGPKVGDTGLIHKPEGRECGGEVFVANPGQEPPEGITEGEGGDAEVAPQVRRLQAHIGVVQRHVQDLRAGASRPTHKAVGWQRGLRSI